MVAFNQPRGLFGASRNIMPGDQPMLPQPTLGAGPVGMGMPQPVPQMVQSQPNLTGERLFALGGILQGDQNAAGSFHQMQQQRAMMAQKAQQDALSAMAERQQEREDFMFRTDYERANPGPSPVERDATAWARMTPEQRAAYQQLQEAKPEYRQGADGQFYRVQVGGAAPQPQILGQTLPQGWTVQGGGAGNGAGVFPR